MPRNILWVVPPIFQRQTISFKGLQQQMAGYMKEDFPPGLLVVVLSTQRSAPMGILDTSPLSSYSLLVWDYSGHRFIPAPDYEGSKVQPPQQSEASFKWKKWPKCLQENLPTRRQKFLFRGKISEYPGEKEKFSWNYPVFALLSLRSQRGFFLKGISIAAPCIRV